MYKRYILALLLVVFLTTMGSTCGCGSSSKEKLEQVSLVMWHVFDEEAVMKPIIDLYEKLNPNIKIEYVKKSYADYEQSTVDALASGKGPDIWMINSDWTLKHHQKLISQPKNLFRKSTNDTRTDVEIYNDMFPDIASEQNIINDEIYGTPLFIDTLVVYYNTNHFKDIRKDLIQAKRADEAKMFNYPPNNWEEFLAMSKILTKKDDSGNIIRAGAAMGVSGNISNSHDVLTALMLQNNTNMTSADRLTSTINLPITKDTGEVAYAGTQALNFYTSFSDPQKDNYMWNDKMSDHINAFMKGEVSMIIDYGALRNRLAQEAPNFRYRVGPLPQVAGATNSVDYASYWVETVTNNCENPVEAWKFIKYLSEKSATYNNVTKTPSVKRVSNIAIPNTKERATKGGVPFRYQPMTAAYFYKGNYPKAVDNIFYEMIEEVAIKNVPAQTAIDKAAATITESYKTSAQENNTQ